MQIGSLLLALLGLGVVLGLVVLSGRAARAMGLPRRLGHSGGGRLAAVQALALDSRRRLHLLRCDDRHFLVLTGGGQDVFIGWVEAPASGTGA
jgi:flagellar protein FliO/FliZ